MAADRTEAILTLMSACVTSFAWSKRSKYQAAKNTPKNTCQAPRRASPSSTATHAQNLRVTADRDKMHRQYKVKKHHNDDDDSDWHTLQQ